ncbi:IPT/TIG domain-containing protein [bacterium]|nr:IPT/TIG domain-containing protein [bacterium]
MRAPTVKPCAKPNGPSPLLRRGSRWSIVLLATVLSACQLAPNPLVGPLPGLSDAVTVAGEAANTAIHGAVSFPGMRVQAAPDYASSNATLTLIGLADNLTVVTGKTNTDGTFVLSLNGFTPSANSYFLLEASRGLNNHAAGNTVARFRTILKWTGSAWTSISGTTIAINSQTTAVAIESSLDPVNVPPGGTIGKVSGTTINASPALTGHPDSEIATLAASIAACLTNDFDPVGSVPAIVPSVTALQPSTVAANGAMLLQGRGFSPIASANTVLFGTATASIFFASPTSLGVYVPAAAPSSGVLKVTTSLGTSPESPTFAVSGSGGGTGGSGGGAGSSPVITGLSRTTGDTTTPVTVTGTDFDAFGTASLVRFNQISAPFLSSWSTTQAVAQVPGPTLAGRVSGPVLLGTRQGLLSQPFGTFTASTSVTENFLDNNLWDSDNSLNVVWSGGPRILYDGDLTVPAGTTTFAPPRSILASDGNVGAQNVIVGNSQGFQPGQEVFLIQLFGTGAGYWEFNTIKSINGSVLTMTNALAHTYNQGQSLCQKVPHYGTVTVNGTLTTQGVSSLGLSGGFIVFRSDTLTVNPGGVIQANSLGATGGVYNGAAGVPNGSAGNSATNGGGSGLNNGRGGGGYAEGGTVTNDGSRVPGGVGIGSNGGGGGNNNGAGGGYGTAGQGVSGSGGYATGGAAGGTADLSRIFPGAGGGAEHNSGTSSGGNGGGVIFINASTLTNNGLISSNGGSCVSYGGGGSGGSIFLNASTMSLAANSVTVTGGSGNSSTWGSNYTAGGFGRVRLSYDKLGGVNYPNSGAETTATGASTPRYSSTALSLYQIASGTVQSLAYDTGTLAPTYVSPNTSQTLNGGTLSFQYSSSPDGVSWSPWIGTFANVPARRYIRWKATVTGNAVLNSLSLIYNY